MDDNTTDQRLPLRRDDFVLKIVKIRILWPGFFFFLIQMGSASCKHIQEDKGAKEANRLTSK